VRILVLVWALMGLALPAFGAGEAKHEITVVYWGAADCRWCRLWEMSPDNMEKSFLASQDFKRLKYYRVKSARLSDEYRKEHFPPGLEWLWERYEWKEFSISGRPGWQVFVDRKLVDSFYGTNNWQTRALPRIQELLEQKRE